MVGADRNESRDLVPDRFVKVQLEQPEDVCGLVNSIREAEGRLDTIVNNAAVLICRPVGKLSIEEWDEVMRVNLRAPFLLMQEGLSLLRSSRGSVVNVCSVHARHTSVEMSAYAASKGGLEAFTRAAALDLAEFGIRVNAVLPGAVDTAMLRQGLEREVPGRVEGDEVLEAFSRRQIMGRVARPEEVAEAVLFLADGRRASYVTGASLLVDGGSAARLSTE